MSCLVLTGPLLQKLMLLNWPGVLGEFGYWFRCINLFVMGVYGVFDPGVCGILARWADWY